MIVDLYMLSKGSSRASVPCRGRSRGITIGHNHILIRIPIGHVLLFVHVSH